MELRVLYPTVRSNMNEMILYLSLAVLTIANIFATTYIGKAVEYERIQKILQIALIWLIPILGCGFLSYFLWTQRKSVGRIKLNQNDSNITQSESINHGVASDDYGGR